MIMHALLTAYDYHQALKNQQIANLREQEARHLVRCLQHELRGHADALQGLLKLSQEMLIQPDGADNLRTNLHFLEITIKDIDDLLQQLLILSREGTLPSMQMDTISVRQLLNQVQTTTQASYYRPDLTVVVDSTDDITLCGSHLYLELAVRTAVRNAIEAMDQTIHRTAQIILSTRVTANHIQIRIEDTGPGFPLDLLEEFCMARTLDGRLAPGWSTKVGGHGLGLALIDRIAALHGGRVRFGNKQHFGAWVELHLPSAKAGVQ